MCTKDSNANNYRGGSHITIRHFEQAATASENENKVDDSILSENKLDALGREGENDAAVVTQRVESHFGICPFSPSLCLCRDCVSLCSSACMRAYTTLRNAR